MKPRKAVIRFRSFSQSDEKWKTEQKVPSSRSYSLASSQWFSLETRTAAWGSGCTPLGVPHAWTRVAKASVFLGRLPYRFGWVWLRNRRFVASSGGNSFFTCGGIEEDLGRVGAGAQHHCRVTSPSFWCWPWASLALWDFCASIYPFLWPWLRNLRCFDTSYIFLSKRRVKIGIDWWAS